MCLALSFACFVGGREGGGGRGSVGTSIDAMMNHVGVVRIFL